MKLKTSFQYLLVVLEFLSDVHQVIEHVLLVLRRQSDIYLEVSCTERIIQIINSLILEERVAIEYSNLLERFNVFSSVRTVHGSDSPMRRKDRLTPTRRHEPQPQTI